MLSSHLHLEAHSLYSAYLPYNTFTNWIVADFNKEQRQYGILIHQNLSCTCLGKLVFLTLTQLLIWTACSSLLRNSVLNPHGSKLLPMVTVDEAVVCGDRPLCSGSQCFMVQRRGGPL